MESKEMSVQQSVHIVKHCALAERVDAFICKTDDSTLI
jgi:hypothetical protein